MYTPSWFVRLETNCTPVEYSLIKNCIHFWVRILKKPKSSIIRQCYDALKKGKNCTKMKFNWVKDLFVLLKKYECENLLCLDSLKFGKMTQNDIIRMENSQLIPHLLKTKSHVQVESLYNINCKWSLVKLAVNIKANLGRLPVAGKSLELATNNSFFDPDKDTNV
jgi:hypothetical protein